MEYIEILKENLMKNQFIEIVISGKLNSEVVFNKVGIKPFLKDNKLNIQFSYIYDKKTMHENIEVEDLYEKLNKEFSNFKQMIIFTVENDYQILRNKKGIKIIKQKPTKKINSLEHNRKKNYIIEENKPCKFLEILGVMNENGKVYKDKYDKFRQINKYLEFIRDIKDEITKKEKLE